MFRMYALSFFSRCCGAAALFGLLALPSWAQQPPAVRTLDLPAVLAAARENIEVSLARRQQEVARADILAADRAPTPVLSAKAGAIDLDHGLGPGSWLTRKPIDKGLGLDWTLERGNKRALRTQTARQNAEAAGLDTQEVVVQQQILAAAAFYELMAAQDKLAQLDDLARAASELAGIAQRRLRAGDISQQEALRTDIEAQRAQAERRAAQAERERTVLALARLTGLPAPLAVRSDWPATQALQAAAPELAQRPDVRAAERRVEAARAALETALAQRRNDVTVGTSLNHQPGTSRAMLELRLQMPLAGVLGNYAYEGEIRRAQAQLDQASDELERTRRQAVSEQARLLEDLRAAAARAQFFEVDITPRARRVAEMSELAYSRGALPLVELVDARRTLRAVLLDQVAARAEHARALAAWQLRAASVQP